MDKLLTVLLIFVNISITSRDTKFPLLGKWQLMEYEANNGNKDYRTKIKNGQILTFAQKNIVTDGLGNVGNYETNGDSLKIRLLNKTQFYRFHFYNNDYLKLFLTPVTDRYEIICDEGCAYIYNKQ